MEVEVNTIIELKDIIGSICESNVKKYPNLYIDITKYKNYNNLSDKWYLLIYKYYNNITEDPICNNNICNNKVKFIDSVNGFREFCSKNCMLNSDEVKDRRKKTCIDKYGVDNPSKSKDIREKIENTNLSKFGVKYPLMSNDIKEKVKKTCIDKYGVDNPSKLDSVKDKRTNTIKEKYGVSNYSKTDEYLIKTKESKKNKYGDENYNNRKLASLTCIDKYGVDNYSKTDEYLNKSKETCIRKYGVSNYSKTQEYRNGYKERLIKSNELYFNKYNYKFINYINSDLVILQCDECLKEFEITKQLFRKRIDESVMVCTICNNKYSPNSKHEIDIKNFISENLNYVVESDKFILNGKELDIYLPDLKIAFEYNGLYWHSELYKDRNYHLNKTENCLIKNIHLIHIYEDDWIYKQDIVKSRILNIIGKTSNKIYARKCEIKEIHDNKIVREFLISNHIQGFVGSKVKIGLFYNNELVSIMTFGSLRKNLNSKSKEGSWELLRFCNKLNTSVIGGASKLFKYFINNYEYESVISYADRSWSKGDLYRNLGFKQLHQTNPNYYYVNNKIRYNRFNFRKDKLISEGFDKNKTELEIMRDRGYYRIYDSGSYKFEYIKS